MGLFKSLKGNAHPSGIIGGDSDPNNPTPTYSAEDQLDPSSSSTPSKTKNKSKTGSGPVSNKDKLNGFIGSGSEYIPTVPGTMPGWHSNAGGNHKSKYDFDYNDKLEAYRTVSSDVDANASAKKPQKAMAVEREVDPSVVGGSSSSTGKEKKKSRFSLAGLRKPYELTEEDLRLREKFAMTPEEARKVVMSQPAGIMGPPGAGLASMGMASRTS